MRIYEEINALPPAGIGNLIAQENTRLYLRNRRNEFRIIVKKQAEANEAARTSAKTTQLEADWGRFETEVQKYRRKLRRANKPTAGDFQASGRGPIESWREAAHKFQAAREGICSRTSQRNRRDGHAHEGRRRRSRRLRDGSPGDGSAASLRPKNHHR